MYMLAYNLQPPEWVLWCLLALAGWLIYTDIKRGDATLRLNLALTAIFVGLWFAVPIGAVALTIGGTVLVANEWYWQKTKPTILYVLVSAILAALIIIEVHYFGLLGLFFVTLPIALLKKEYRLGQRTVV